MFGSITSGKHLHADECGTWEKCCKIARWQTLPQRNQQCLKPPKPFNKWKRKPNIVFKSVCAFRNHIFFFCEQTKCLRFNLCEWYTNDLHQSVRDCNGLLHTEAVGFPTNVLPHSNCQSSTHVMFWIWYWKRSIPPMNKYAFWKNESNCFA